MTSIDRVVQRENGSIMQLFDEQLTCSSSSIALVFGSQELTYRQLSEKANRLARHLQNSGVGPESIVGVCIERSVEMVVAILGILRAGGAYLPLDPEYPTGRTTNVIADSGATIVITTDRDRARLPTVDARLLSLDGEEATIANCSPDVIPSTATAKNLAYLIYTSGSTGTPKGVMVEHRNVVSFFTAMDLVLGTEPGVWLAVTSISFDISVLELLWTLTRGFKVILHGNEGTHTITSEIVRHGVTHFQSTPSLARMLATDPRSLAALGSLKKLLLGGEALPASLVDMIRPDTTGDIFNMYGPTETTVWSAVFRITQSSELGTTVPIGRPLANTKAYILDAQLKHVPSGEPGELFLGGEGVARGYWQRPELTEERFLADPFESGSRIYRTGDVVRLRADGDLEFLGRTDFQVKIRGYRIELGEIEAGLELQPGVRQAVVVAREDKPGDKRLVAYIVSGESVSLSTQTLRAGLEANLPEFMVPSHFVFLDRLPLTANGKIDRNALPAAYGQNAQAESLLSTEKHSPDDIEGIIASVWAEALGLAVIDKNENIFDLGVTSLMVPEVLLEMQRRLDREIPLIDLFEFHTVKDLAAHLAGNTVKHVISDRAQRRIASRIHQGSS
jgi:amino acid adenylation domain-containing protein